MSVRATMSLFDPNAYGRPKAKARRVREPVSEGKQTLLEDYYYFNTNHHEQPKAISYLEYGTVLQTTA